MNVNMKAVVVVIALTILLVITMSEQNDVVANPVKPAPRGFTWRQDQISARGVECVKGRAQMIAERITRVGNMWCNTCRCVGGRWACTRKGCHQKKHVLSITGPYTGATASMLANNHAFHLGANHLAKPIINHCGVDGVAPHGYTVTLKSQLHLDTKEDKLSFLQGWIHQYEPETHAVHFFTETPFAVVVKAGDEAISLIAKDDTVDSIECGCLQRKD